MTYTYKKNWNTKKYNLNELKFPNIQHKWKHEIDKHVKSWIEKTRINIYYSKLYEQLLNPILMEKFRISKLKKD